MTEPSEYCCGCERDRLADGCAVGPDELKKPPTEAEIGDVLYALSVIPALRHVVRRLALQRDTQAAEIARMTSALEGASAKCLRLTRSQLTGEPVAYVYGCDAFGVGVLSSRHWTPVDAIEAALKRLKKEES